MPFCSSATLQAWLKEFDADGPGGATAYVAEQEPCDGRDGGLVIYPLRASRLSVYIEPRSPGSLDWCVRLEGQADGTSLTSHALRELCYELSAAAVLCDYLQGKAFALHVDQTRFR